MNMLVLTRKLAKAILVGDDIRITVLAVHGNCVRLGITAPDGVPIRREELGQPEHAASPPPRRGD
jgi:carbon storage regulator